MTNLNPSSQSTSVYGIQDNDPKQQLIDREHVSEEELAQITELMEALSALRDAEKTLSAASRKYMKLNDTDMRALHFIIVCMHRDTAATPSSIAQYLDISSAATTKLLDRLERAGHINRTQHPNDRRALVITITSRTYRAAMGSMGKQQSKRFYAAARLSSAERDVVIRFLRDMTKELEFDPELWSSAAELNDEPQ